MNNTRMALLDHIISTNNIPYGREGEDMMKFILDEYSKHYDKSPCRNSALTGHDYVLEILNGNPTRCYESFRMEPPLFKLLCEELKGLGITHSRYLTAQEQVAIFLMTLSHNQRIRVLAERFQHSTYTIHEYFHLVLDKVVELGKKVIVPPDLSVCPTEIRDNPRFWPYFKNCVGALDGTHIHAHIPINDQIPFRGRKGDTTQNILAVCSFDMKFTYVLAGWEGFANDSRILNECLADDTLQFPLAPPGKYYLVDSCYANRRGFLAPYRGSRYHLPDIRRAGGMPRGRNEMYNYRHSSLRNVIERCFGILKMRFSILRQMPPYKFTAQVKIVVACCAIHNFIKMKLLPDSLFDNPPSEASSSHENEDEDDIEDGVSHDRNTNTMDLVRNSIAQDIFDSTLAT